tara:strand:- start:2013 stop:3074 length:1062 start_codon:yes stop_codon:yes gene_type:complete
MSGAVIRCEYIWLDGGVTPQLRSKTRVITVNSEDEDWKLSLSDLPVWGFDGSSTGQATTSDSDCVLRPVFACIDSNRQNGILVLCDVLNSDLTPHESNTRARLIDSMIANGSLEPFVGFEQEYFIYNKETNRPLGWPTDGEPSPQGQYYCGVGAENVDGRSLSELHLSACISSGLSIQGVNAEVALGQWEYQIGGPGINAVASCDHLWVSRFIMQRIAESKGWSISLDPKPIDGDWNGSGLHTNFSTNKMREEGGMEHILSSANKLGASDALSLVSDFYGEGLNRRLTGNHETSKLDEFKVGVSDRAASIRIPWQVEKQGFGYFEDRRPNSNADPYKVLRYIMDAVSRGENEQ